MKTVLAEYLSRKIIEDIRSGKTLSPEICESVCHFPLIDFLRRLVQPDDWNHIKLLLEANHVDIRTLGRALLNRILNVNGVREYLVRAWRSSGQTIRDKIGLQFTLLNYEDLDPQVQKELSEFVFENWNEWLSEGTTRWAAGEQNVLDFVRKRLSDEKTTPTKRWVYICGAAASPDKNEVIRIIEEYVNNSDAFLSEIARRVLEKVRSNY
jgi:NADPH-dependent ferric siderophore reductase